LGNFDGLFPYTTIDDNPPRGRVAQAWPEIGQVAEGNDLFYYSGQSLTPEAKQNTKTQVISKKSSSVERGVRLAEDIQS
jgi:hypothetical protein